MNKAEWEKLTTAQQNMILFVMVAYEILLNHPYNKVHTVYTGFNKVFRETFGKDSNPVAVTHWMASCSLLYVGSARGGAVIGKGSGKLEFRPDETMSATTERYRKLLQDFKNSRSGKDTAKTGNGSALTAPLRREVDSLAQKLWDGGFADQAAQVKKALE